MKTQSLFGRSIVLAALYAALALPAPIGAVAEDEGEAFELGDIFVVGSRRPVRSTADTPAPIDLIGGEDFTDQGATNLPDLMRTLIPSYNVSSQPISDAATFVRPANLRGLAADQTLVFVNGKRRHRAPVITWLGNGVSEGAQGPDISVIPAVALERVEVLRDTASAQYGSDAIAGVINYVLKGRPDGGVVETQWGRAYEGDGAEYRVAGNVGIPISESGFANLSAQWHEAEPTVRSVQRADAAHLIAIGNSNVRQPYAQVWGTPDVQGDYSVFVNSGMELSEMAEVYAFGNVAGRETEGGFFFRAPSGTPVRHDPRGGVFSYGDRKYRLIGAEDPTNLADVEYCKDLRTEFPVGVTDTPFDVGGFTAAHGDRCFVFNERFPGGFTPQFKGTVTDSAATTGVKGRFDENTTYDLSYTFGRGEIEFSIRDTINASLGLSTPTRFSLGSYVQTEQTANFDVTRAIDVSGLESPLHVAAGLEWRREQFEITAGERQSWIGGPLASDGFGTGANGFSGFSKRQAGPDGVIGTTDDLVGVTGDWNRDNIAGYIDVETDVDRNLTLATMGRVERFDDFGTTTDAKIGALYRVNDRFGIRGSASTGFRVPTVGQENVSNVTTAFSRNETTGEIELNQRGTVPAYCGEASILGAQLLTPEESVTFTAGIVAEAGLVSLTADVYNIDVDDRLGLSKSLPLSEDQKNEVIRRGDGCILLGEGSDIGNIRYFANGFDTRTRGVDLVATLDVSAAAADFLASGETELVFVGNWTRTKVVRHDSRFIDDQRIDQLQNALPKTRFNVALRHDQSKWSAFTRVNYFGPYHEWHADSWLIDVGNEVTLDAEVSYRPVGGLELSIGAENILNNFPDELNSFTTDDGKPIGSQLGSKYPESSPMGLLGGFYYARARYVF